MADTKLADLTALTTPSGDDILYIVDDPAGTPLDRKIALDNLFTRGTITADAPVLNMSQTWNNGAVTFTGLKFNANTGSSASGSLLLDLQTNTGGAATSQFKVRKDGVTTVGNNLDIVYEGTTRLSIWPSLSQALAFRSDNFIGWSSTTTVPGTADVILGRRAAANLRFGAADTTGTTAPTPQFLSAQSWASSTTNNQTGANFTIDGSQGTGTGAGGSIIFRVAPAGAVANGVQNALATALTINTNDVVVNTSANRFFTVSDKTGETAGVNIQGSTGSISTLSGAAIQWTNSATNSFSTPDVVLRRDAANTLALRNGANAQTFRVYNTTDGTNSEFGKIAWSSNVLQIGTEKAGTGTARALEFQTDGTTRLTISTAGNATVTGWIKSNLYFDAPAALLGGNGGIYFGTAGANGSQVQSTGAGVIALGNYGGSDFNRIQFGGTTSSFPALKRSSTTLQARLADDSAFASVQGKLTTDTAYAAGDPTTTGYLVVYDSTGTAYKIPALAV